MTDQTTETPKAKTTIIVGSQHPGLQVRADMEITYDEWLFLIRLGQALANAEWPPPRLPGMASASETYRPGIAYSVPHFPDDLYDENGGEG